MTLNPDSRLTFSAILLLIIGYLPHRAVAQPVGHKLFKKGPVKSDETKTLYFRPFSFYGFTPAQGAAKDMKKLTIELHSECAEYFKLLVSNVELSVGDHAATACGDLACVRTVMPEAGIDALVSGVAVRYAPGAALTSVVFELQGSTVVKTITCADTPEALYKCFKKALRKARFMLPMFLSTYPVAKLSANKDGGETTTDHPSPDSWIKQIGPYEYALIDTEMDKVMADLSYLGKQARIIPNYKNGSYQGFKLIGVRPKSVYRYMGIRSGDIITAIDGELINSPNKALKLLKSINSGDKTVVQMMRRGKPMTLVYTQVSAAAFKSHKSYQQGTSSIGVNSKLLKNKDDATVTFPGWMKETAPGQFLAQEEQWIEAVGSIENIGKQARLIPWWQGGNYMGLKLTGVQENSIFGWIGLKSYDRIIKVDGEPVNSASKMMILVDVLLKNKKFRLDCNRKGEPFTIEVELVKKLK